MIARLASGYIYYVSLTRRHRRGASRRGRRGREDRGDPAHGPTLPVGVGFGIRDGATARAICDVADAAIIGSRIIQEIEAGGPDGPGNGRRGSCAGARRAMDRGVARHHELVAETAAAEDPAHRRRAEEECAGGPVEQVPGVRRRAVRDRPREERQRLPEVRPSQPRSTRASGSTCCSIRRAVRDRRRSDAGGCAQVQGQQALSRPAGGRARRRPARPTRWWSCRARSRTFRWCVPRSSSSSWADRWARWSASGSCAACRGARPEPAARVLHRHGRRAHAGGPALADADGEDHARR